MIYYLVIEIWSDQKIMGARFSTNAGAIIDLPDSGIIENALSEPFACTEFKRALEYYVSEFSFIDKLNEHNLSLIQEIRAENKRTFYFK